jgi:probable F420-dependent oxidoreductase
MTKLVKLGVVFPQTEIGTDPQEIKEYAEAAEKFGFDYLLAFDHILGANKDSRPIWKGPYSHVDSFYEPFVLFGHLAALTSKIQLATGIIILPQRQTALVAKQAATLDVLSSGRLRLGIGIGWNDVEYEALGEAFHNRGVRSEEQIEVLRSLWTKDLTTYDGKWHKITDAGINPLPLQRPIPIWIGGSSERVLRRIGRMGDGWISTNLGIPDMHSQAVVDRIHKYALDAGRDPSRIGIETWVSARDGHVEELAAKVVAWRDFGATHVAITTMGAGYSSVSEHIDAIGRFKTEVEIRLAC